MRLAPIAIAVLFASPAAAETTLRVMTFNLWGAGGNEEKPIDETVAVLRAANPDIVGLQETMLEGETCTAEACPPDGESRARALAEALGYQYHDQVSATPGADPNLWANAVLSRYPITGTAPGDLGVSIDVDGQTVWIFNIHLDDEPYQPYQLLDIEYGPAPFVDTAEEAIRWAAETRGPALDILEPAMAVAEGAAAVFVTGDFNEPSGHDWTDAAVAAGFQPLPVMWPTTARIEGWGFTDAYRAVHPDAAARPAFTWTPMYDEAATDDHPDRIDFVLVKGATVADAWIVGETGPRTDLAVDPWPSDHRAVLAEVRF